MGLTIHTSHLLTIESRPPSKFRQQIDCCLICSWRSLPPFQFVFQILSVGFNACHISSARSFDCRNKRAIAPEITAVVTPDLMN